MQTVHQTQNQIVVLMHMLEETRDATQRQELEYEKDVLFAELYLLQFPDDDGEAF